MKLRGLLTLPVMALLILSVALCSVGTATAAGLSKGAVKKIATKVVKKQAPKLTVATANNANALAGLPATAFQTNVAVYTAAVTPATDSFDIVLPLTVGRYLVSYSVYLASPLAADCFIRKTIGSDDTFVGEESADANVYNPGLSAVAYIEVVPAMVVKLQCSADSAVTTTPAQPIQIIVQKVDSASVGTLTATATRAAGRQH